MILRAKLSQTELMAIPATQRKLFLGLLFVANEITILLRCMLWSHWRKGDGADVMRGQLFAHAFFQRLLASKIWEAWQLLQKSYYSDPASAELLKKWAPDGLDVAKEIGKELGKQSPLYHIRNSVGFHLDDSALDRELSEAGEPLYLYVEDHGVANTLYYFADALASHSALRSMPEPGLNDVTADSLARISAYDKIVLRLANLFTKFGQHFARAVTKSCGPQIWEEAPIPIEGAFPSILDQRFPWFTDASGLGRAWAAADEPH